MTDQDHRRPGPGGDPRDTSGDRDARFAEDGAQEKPRAPRRDPTDAAAEIGRPHGTAPDSPTVVEPQAAVDEERKLAREAAARTSAHAEGRSMPQTIGQYRVLGLLGEGGMGVVYEAEQQQPRRRVAVKVVRGGEFVDEQRVRLLRREADTLARLRHPNIAAIHEAGRTEDGQHYFAMELVRGPMLSEYLRGRPAPTTREELEHRLRLFRSIAEAVHYAHQRGVIHRDLKPSNIVVRGEAAKLEESSASGVRVPQVKILDFGLARITDADVAAATMVTEVGVIKGTLAYMSPEQARGNPDEIDVRADVYALGVILYEMIAGARPYDVSGGSIVEAVRVICEAPPRPLRETWSGGRRIDADLETIVGKALEKETGRRYASAAALSEDVGRFMASEPILARPPSTIYQMRRFTRRHKALVGGLAATIIALVAGFVASTTLYVRAEDEARRARDEAAKSEQVAAFMTEMLAGVGPSVAQGRDTTLLREILDKTAQRVGEELADQPVVEAVLRTTLGNTYSEMGEYDSAREQLELALKRRRAEKPGDDVDVAMSLGNLGQLFAFQGEGAQAETLLREGVEMAARIGPEADEERGLLLTNFGNLLVSLERYDEAEAPLVEALELRRRVLGEGHEDVATGLNSLGNLYHHLGRYEQAGELYEKALEIHRRELGETHPFVLTDLHNLAYLKRNKGDHRGAVAMFREVLALQRQIFDGDHPNVASGMDSLAGVLSMMGDKQEAEELLRDSLAMRRRLLGDENLDVARSLDALGNLLNSTSRSEQALELQEQALAIRRRLLGDRSPAVATSLQNMAYTLSDLGRTGEALELAGQSLEIQRERFGEDHKEVLLNMNNIGRLQQAAGDLAGAESTFRETLEARERVLGPDNIYVGTTSDDLAEVLLERGRLDEAEALSRRAVKIYEANVGDDHAATMSCRRNLGRVLREQGRGREAVETLRPVADWVEAKYGTTHRSTLRVLADLARALAMTPDGAGEAGVLYDRVLAGGAGVLSDGDLEKVRRWRAELATSPAP